MADQNFPVPFNLKYFDQLTASKLNWLIGAQGEITDFNIGSVIRTMLEAVSMEEEEIYYRLYLAIRKAIPIAIYLTFDFTLEPAATATGTVTFSRSTPAPVDYVIPQGTEVLTTDGTIFKTTHAVTLLTGTTSIAAPILAESAGLGGNVLSSSITRFKTALVGIEAVTNAAATTGGQDQETEDSRKQRFQDFILSLARSTVGGIAAGARTVKLTDVNGGILEQVKKVLVYEPFLHDPNKPVGNVNVYLDNGTGTASSGLLNLAQKVLDGYIDNQSNPVIGYKAAGVVVNVLAVTAQVQIVAASVVVASGYTLAGIQADLANACQAVFGALDIGENLDWETLLAALMRVTGVKTMTLATPSADVSVAFNARIILGTTTFTAA